MRTLTLLNCLMLPQEFLCQIIMTLPSNIHTALDLILTVHVVNIYTNVSQNVHAMTSVSKPIINDSIFGCSTDVLNDTMLFGQLNNCYNITTETPCVLVVNLSDLKLTPSMHSLLSKGLNFCPTPGEPDVQNLRQGLDKFHVSFSLKGPVTKTPLDSDSILSMATFRMV